MAGWARLADGVLALGFCCVVLASLLCLSLKNV
jgi:hypothetical protein